MPVGPPLISRRSTPPDARCRAGVEVRYFMYDQLCYRLGRRARAENISCWLCALVPRTQYDDCVCSHAPSWNPTTQIIYRVAQPRRTCLYIAIKILLACLQTHCTGGAEGVRFLLPCACRITGSVLLLTSSLQVKNPQCLPFFFSSASQSKPFNLKQAL